MFNLSQHFVEFIKTLGILKYGIQKINYNYKIHQFQTIVISLKIFNELYENRAICRTFSSWFVFFEEIKCFKCLSLQIELIFLTLINMSETMFVNKNRSDLIDD